MRLVKLKAQTTNRLPFIFIELVNLYEKVKYDLFAWLYILNNSISSDTTDFTVWQSLGQQSAFSKTDL